MTKQELYKYLESERQHRLAELERQEHEENKVIKAKVIKQHNLEPLAKSISQYATICINAYDQALSGHSVNTHYNNPYRDLLGLQNADELAENIREDANLGEAELDANYDHFKNLREQVYTSFRKLELLVQDSINAKAAIQSLREIGFNIPNPANEDKSALKQMFSSEIIFGKKEN